MVQAYCNGSAILLRRVLVANIGLEVVQCRYLGRMALEILEHNAAVVGSDSIRLLDSSLVWR